MTEWTVVGVLIAILGLLGTVCAPVLRLNTSITKLTLMLENLQRKFDVEHEENRQAHDRIWKRVDANSEKIAEHETKINTIEHRKECE